MKIKVVGGDGKIVEPAAHVEATPSEVVPDGWMLRQQIATLFDLKPNEAESFKDKIDVLIDYAKSMTDDHSSEGLRWAVRDLSYRVGTPPLGEKMINHLVLYAKLKTDRSKLDEQIAKIERGGEPNAV